MQIAAGPDCARVRHYLEDVSAAGAVAPPSVWLLKHVAGCEHCRGAVALLVAALLAPLPAPLPTNCATCRDELASYIDRELDVGTPAALAAAPAVGWHLWICPECAEIYHLTRSLAEATRAGVLAPLPLGSQGSVSRHILQTLRLSRSFLSYALPRPSPALGAARGNERAETILLSDDESGHRINVSVEQLSNQDWCASVTIMPPITGWLVLTLGDRTFHAYFDDHGQAVVYDVPAALLSAVNGPELIISIELDKIAAEPKL